MIAVAFRIEKLRDDYFVAVSIDRRGGEFRWSTCACADQAAAGPTRAGTRLIEYRGMTTMRGGEQVACHDRSCHVSPLDWTWKHHGWTHGLLARCPTPGPRPAALRTTKPGYSGTIHTISVGDYAWHEGAFRRIDRLVRHGESGGIYAVKYAGVRKYARVHVGTFEVQDLGADAPEQEEVSV